MATLNTTNIKHESSGSNNIVLASNGSVTIPTLTATSLTTSSSFGKLLQFQSVKWGAYTSTTSTSYIDTGLTCNITPSSTSSKIIISGRIQLCKTSYTAVAQLLRDSTVIGSNPDTGTNSDLFTFYSASSYMSLGVPFMHDDSPNTTSQVTYKLQIKSDGGNTLYMNGHNNNSGSYLSMSYMSLMEVAA